MIDEKTRRRDRRRVDALVIAAFFIFLLKCGVI
jgi:hypothetical protein